MTREELLKLLALRDLSPAELRAREPQLWQNVLEHKRAEAQARLNAAVAAAPVEVREHVARLDLSGVSGAETLSVARESLGRSTLRPEIVRESVARLERLERVPDIAVAIDETRPVREDPDIALLVEKARLHELGGIARIGEQAVEAIAAEAPRPGAIGNDVLARLVEAQKLSPEQAQAVGTTAAVYELVEGDAQLAAAIGSATFPRLGGRPAASTRDLALLGAADWEAFLTAGGVALPEGTRAAESAGALADRFAALHPGVAFVGQLPRIEPPRASMLAEAIQPLFARNPAVVRAEFSALDTQGLTVDQVEMAKPAHAELRRLARAYPGFALDEVLDDPARAAAEKAAIVSRRVSLIEKVQERLAGGDLLALDYTPGSPDVTGLDLAGLGATPDEQPMVLSTLKAYQRAFALTGRVDDAQRLIEGGFLSATAIGTRSRDAFISASGLDTVRGDRYWRDARGSLMEGALALGSVVDASLGLFDELGVGNVQPATLEFLRKLDGFEALFGNLSFCACQHCQSILSPAAYFVDLMRFVDQHVRPQLGAVTDHPLDLKTRRPDLWTLELTCANTETRLPTLEIVNEILENFVARRQGHTGPLSDRPAVTDVVYRETLLDAVDSFEQPFHLPLARVHAYLDDIGDTRAELVRALGGGPRTVSDAQLRLSPQESSLITNAVSSLGELSGLYDLAFTAAGASVAPVDAQELARATGLDRERLGRVAATGFMAAGGAAIEIRAEKRGPDSIQNDVERVHGLTPDALDRIHRFVRLWRKLAWSIPELDRILTSLGVTSLDAAALRLVGAARDVQERLGLSSDETAALVGALPLEPAGESLVDRLFNPAEAAPDSRLPNDASRFVHPAFRRNTAVPQDPALPRLLSGLGVDLATLAVLARRLAPHLASATQPGFDPEAADENNRHFVLSLANLGLLYRHARLARALRIGAEDLFALIELAGIGGRIATPDDLVAVLDLHAWYKASGFRLDELAVATGRVPRDPSRFIEPAALAAEIVTRPGELLEMRDTVFSVALGTTEQASRDLLTGNSNLVEKVGEGRWRLIAGVEPAGQPIAVPPSATVPVAPAGSRPVTAEEVRSVLSAYRPAGALARRLGADFGFEPAKVEALVRLAGASLDAEPLARALRGEGPADPVRDLIAALRPLAVAFRAREWDAAALDFVRENPTRFGLTTAALTMEGLRALSVYARLARRLLARASDAATATAATLTAGPATVSTAPATAADIRSALAAFDTALPGFPASADEIVGRILGVSPGLVAGLRGRVALSAVAAHALDALDRAAHLAARLGVDGEAFAAIASDDYAALSRAADALLIAIRAREPDAKRREERVMRAEEPLREVRRDALAAFLVHSLEPRLFATRDDLQPHFLIDVQSGGCLTTSRVVAAISSVQLYVHRVIMHLEASLPDAPDHLLLRLPESAAAEWTWRKNYRVWEANRKVFLWPENYIEPDLRDDKTPLFEQLEAELLQTEISDQNVLDAYTKYLKDFEELASLTIAGAYHDVRTEGERTIDVLHLFGVSAADPPAFYHRTCENLIASGRDPKKTAVWSPWRKTDVQITGRRLSPVVFRGRLHVFWADYKTRPVNQVEEGGSRFAGYRHTMSVRFTTLRQDGTWSAPQAVLLPSSGEFGPGGRGAISDLLSGPLPKPLLDDRPHPEPMDDYTVSGPNWDWLWLEPASVGGRQVLTMRYRDFLEFGEIDLYRRLVIPGFINLATDPAPRLLCERGGTLHYGSPQYWNIVWRWGRTPTANLAVDDERLAVLSRENSVLRALLEPGLFVEAIASLAPGTEILAIPGSVEDGILQVGPDVILLQGSVTPGDDYVLRRIGTTLAEELGYRLFADGVDGLLDIETQKALREAALPLTPIGSRIDDRGNAGRLDLTGPYGVYYREILFHVPFLIANALNGRGQFAAAQRWYHYIFDATSTEVIQVPPGTPPEERARRLLDRVWRYVEFRNLDVTRLRETLTDENALAVYHDDPFNPHAIARLRLSAYQKAVVMKYVDNLVDWADHLFTQFTMETVNEALMLYLMAADILGPRPARLGDCGEGAVQPKTFETIAGTLGAGEELLVELESLILASRMRARRRKTPVGPVRPHFTPDRGTLATARRFAPLRRPGIAPADVVVIGDGGVFGDGRFGGLGGVFEGAVLEDPTRGGTVQSGQPFRGLAWRSTRTGGWVPRLGASVTAGAGNGGGNGRGLGRVRDHFRRLDPADWVGGFGWSILSEASPVFCIPANKDLLAYWDRVEDRLFKIRNCMDISGQKRELALFAPEIEPGLLVRMRAAGLTLEDVLGGTSGSLPPYRFLFVVDRAKSFAATLNGFGAAFLSALEKKDAEELSRLRLVHQQNLARLTSGLRRLEVDVAEEALAALERQKEAAEYRRDFYDGLVQENRSATEEAQSMLRHLATAIHLTEAYVDTHSAIFAAMPQVGSPFAMKYGGVELNTTMRRFGNAIHAVAQGMEAAAASAGLESGFDRRSEGWRHQRTLAEHDLKQLDRHLEAARIRLRIAQRALDVHETSLDHLDEQLELLDAKFSSLGLYTFLSTELRRLYRGAYSNALALARLAEQAFRFERGEEEAPGLAATYWDPVHAGLLAGEQLLVDLQTLERRYLETNYRCLEVDQAFALSQVAPQALVQLRETGECRFAIPEVFFDLFYPGHFRRRTKSVRLTIPSITGPFANVSATLTLERSWIRAQATPGAALVEVPPRRSTSVATSTAQNDAGVFELSFRDERYMPFEGTGAVGEWHLALPRTFRQFDYQTINDVILSISYTAEADGALRERVEASNAALEGSVLHFLANNPVGRLFSVRQDFSGAFTRLLHSPPATPVRVEISDAQFPRLVRGRTLEVSRSALLLRTGDGTGPGAFQISVDGQTLGGFAPDATLGGLPARPLPPGFLANLRGPHTFAVTDPGDLAPATPTPGDTSAIDADKLLDVLLYVEYTVSAS